MTRNDKIKALNALIKGDSSLLERRLPEKPLFVNYRQIEENKYQLEENEKILNKAEIKELEAKVLNQKQPQFLVQC